ncbi:hypothetical protein Tco_0049688, partial [Tanacetum coccineum]
MLCGRYCMVCFDIVEDDALMDEVVKECLEEYWSYFIRSEYVCSSGIFNYCLEIAIDDIVLNNHAGWNFMMIGRAYSMGLVLKWWSWSCFAVKGSSNILFNAYFADKMVSSSMVGAYGSYNI